MSLHQSYKEALITSLQCLEHAEGHAMSAVLNIAFAGPHKELGRLHEIGEILNMEPDMFRDTGDVNIDKILQLIDHIQQVKDAIKNISGL